jgi:Ca2+-transporting ATPase
MKKQENPEEKEKALRRMIEAGVLCNNASIQDANNGTGEPLEVALLEAGKELGMTRQEILQRMPEEKEVSFDPEVKMMATYHRDNGGFRVAVKGAPEEVLERSEHIYFPGGKRRFDKDARKEWEERTDEMAGKGFRVLALAEKIADTVEEEPYAGLTLIGIAGFYDPPRKEIKPAIVSCRRAGMRTIMVTGDQALTAKSVACSLELYADSEPQVMLGKELENIEGEKERILPADIFARVSPRQKLDLISLHQKAGSVVAMTGDGVNDAPALKKADIGIAMGKRGTQAAIQSSDMVLKDDSYVSIIAAVEQGRIIFDNIRKFVMYLIPCHVSEVTAVAIATILQMPLPLLPLQILFLNIITDVFPALALGASEGDTDVMHRPPRKREEAIISGRHWMRITFNGVLMGFTVILAMFLADRIFDISRTESVTVPFLTLGFTSLWHVFNVREKGIGLFRNDIIRNPYVWGALLLGALLLTAAVYLPGFRDIMGLYVPGGPEWGLILAMSFLPHIVSQLAKEISWR